MSKRQHNQIRANLVRACKAHILIGLLFVSQIIIYDAGKLITPDVVLKRWVAAGLFIGTAAICWYMARLDDKPGKIHKLIWILILADIAIASFYVYMQRGMASRAVLLFVIPILLAAVLQRKGAIYLTAILAAVTYAVTAVAYFVLNFNEGYKLELYGEVGFYAAMLLAIGNLSWTLVRTKH